MNNFILRKRLIKYSDKDCKKFLSKDFLHTCCYCLVREGDLGGSADFEKDHFIPKSKSGTDDYDNLNYEEFRQKYSEIQGELYGSAERYKTALDWTEVAAKLETDMDLQNETNIYRLTQKYVQKYGEKR